MKNKSLLYTALLSCWLLLACAGMIIGAATDVVIETAKVPFKVTGAVIDVVAGDDDDDDDD